MNDKKMLELFGGMFLVFIAIIIASFIGGTMLWLTYSHIHALFPTAAEKGVIAKDLGWWDSVCVAWVFSILLKSTLLQKRSINE